MYLFKTYFLLIICIDNDFKLSIGLVINHCMYVSKMPTYKRLNKAIKKGIIIVKGLKMKNCAIAKRVNVHPSSMERFSKEYNQIGQFTEWIYP